MGRGHEGRQLASKNGTVLALALEPPMACWCGNIKLFSFILFTFFSILLTINTQPLNIFQLKPWSALPFTPIWNLEVGIWNFLSLSLSLSFSSNGVCCISVSFAFAFPLFLLYKPLSSTLFSIFHFQTTPFFSLCFFFQSRFVSLLTFFFFFCSFSIWVSVFLFITSPFPFTFACGIQFLFVVFCFWSLDFMISLLHFSSYWVLVS